MADTTPDLAKQGPSVRTVTGWTVFFLVLLRISIGWHFAYEGAWKLMQDDWRATGYLTQSTGPLRPVFLKFVDDPDGLNRLTPESVKERIQGRYDRLAGFYGLTDEQRAPIKVDNLVQQVDVIFADPDFQNQLANYKEFLGKIETQEKALFLYDKNAEPGNTPYNSERWMYNSGKKAAARQALLARAEGPIRDVEAAVLNARTLDQMAKGPPPHEKSQTVFSDWGNMIGLTAVGVCLMLGLFTRLAALGGISLLCLYYFCMPPWPGLPEGPSEGHYLIVNRNMIEAIALAVIAASGVGRWVGLDAFISAWRRKRCGRAAQA
ncbi:MAG TPA: DoxX family protein [Phycisphaerae bacterium]|nr:DoxX family protein [Phycisphaerae bacterium]